MRISSENEMNEEENVNLIMRQECHDGHRKIYFNNFNNERLTSMECKHHINVEKCFFQFHRSQYEMPHWQSN